MASATLAEVYASGPSQNQTMCATGRYANVNQNTMNTRAAENLMRSTSEPRIRQQVMAAKVAWKPTYTSSLSGTPLSKVAALLKLPSAGLNVPLRNSLLRPPMNGFGPSVKASE